MVDRATRSMISALAGLRRMDFQLTETLTKVDPLAHGQKAGDVVREASSWRLESRRIAGRLTHGIAKSSMDFRA
jgi:hypothetical protein